KEMPFMIIQPRVGLFDQHAIRIPMPDPRPRLIRPANTERIIGLARSDYLIERSFDQPLASKPVVVVAETLDAVILCHLCLCRPGFRHSKVIKTEIRWNVRLVVARKKRFSFRRVRPFGEAFPP